MANCIRMLALAASLVATASACNEITDPPKAPDAVILPGLNSVSAPPSAPGDGSSLIRIEATVDTSLKGDARVVKFTTTAGLFGDKNETTVRADTGGIAVAILRAPLDSVTAIVTATAGSTSLRAEIQFALVRAERIDVEPSSFAVEASTAKEISITATLRRATGTPTPGATVTFSAADTLGVAIGRFASAPPSNGSGVVVVRYSAGETSYRGRVDITARTAGASGEVSGGASVQVVNPK